MVGVKTCAKINASYGNSMFATSMVFTMSNGASAPNVIPQDAWVVANLRFAPTDKSEDCFKILKKIAKNSISKWKFCNRARHLR